MYNRSKSCHDKWNRGPTCNTSYRQPYCLQQRPCNEEVMPHVCVHKLPVMPIPDNKIAFNSGRAMKRHVTHTNDEVMSHICIHKPPLTPISDNWIASNSGRAMKELYHTYERRSNVTKYTRNEYTSQRWRTDNRVALNSGSANMNTWVKKTLHVFSERALYTTWRRTRGDCNWQREVSFESSHDLLYLDIHIYIYTYIYMYKYTFIYVSIIYIYGYAFIDNQRFFLAVALHLRSQVTHMNTCIYTYHIWIHVYIHITYEYMDI